MEPTRITLLQRLRSGDDGLAWEDFYEQYSGVIVRYARKMRLDEAQAFDVLQESMIELIRVLPAFNYDASRGRFRNFLLTIVHRRVLKVFRRLQRRAEVSIEAQTDDGVALLDLLPSDAKANPLAESDEQRWRATVVEECLARIRDVRQLDDRSVGIFTAFALEGQSAAEVAERFDSTPNNVYQTKSRILGWLETEVALYLEDATPSEEPSV